MAEVLSVQGEVVRVRNMSKVLSFIDLFDISQGHFDLARLKKLILLFRPSDCSRSETRSPL